MSCPKYFPKDTRAMGYSLMKKYENGKQLERWEANMLKHCLYCEGRELKGTKARHLKPKTRTIIKRRAKTLALKRITNKKPSRSQPSRKCKK